MIGKLISFVGRRLFSERERSEGILRALYERETGQNLDETLAQLGISPEQVNPLFDDLHQQFGAGLLSDDRRLAQTAYPAAVLFFFTKLELISQENDLRTLNELE